MRNCDICGKPIPAERLEALPDTTTCVSCSRTGKKIGYMISNFSKGTASEIVFIQNDPEQLRRAKRANGRRR